MQVMRWAGMAVIALALVAPATLNAQEAAAAQPIPEDLMIDGFLAAHPDLGERKAGIARDEAADFAGALRHYQRAAWYGDKPSQARLGEMYWNGQGVARDRVQGYLWMALASERGFREFAILRQLYWQQLDADERGRAGARDQDMLARYGDAAAKSRLSKVMRRELHRASGSMLGHSAASPVYITRYEGSRPIGVNAEQLYAPQYWDPEQYWQLRDSVWEQLFEAHVEVGDLKPVPGQQAPAPEADDAP
ncbi:MAG TPA: sel1 repeat family protein [Xanthomonadaceae bacterium]|nr:sel1 repeat family protein [Xanthomonadaceae bacterium]